MYTWGLDSIFVSQGLCSNFETSRVPVLVHMLSSVKILLIGASDSHFYAVSSDMLNLFTWGKFVIYKKIPTFQSKKCSFRKSKRVALRNGEKDSKNTDWIETCFDFTFNRYIRNQHLSFHSLILI